MPANQILGRENKNGKEREKTSCKRGGGGEEKKKKQLWTNEEQRKSEMKLRNIVCNDQKDFLF